MDKRMAEECDLIQTLLECDVLKIGNFKLKSGKFSPIYIDLRRVIHYPKVMKDVVAAIQRKQTKENLKIDTICGVPYTAIPIASVFSVFYNVPMVMKRKEAKDYGTKRLVEGAFKTGDFCLLIEDVVCSGTSVKDTVEALRKEGLNVHDCISIVDKKQGGADNLKKVGINLHSLFNIEDIFNVYCSINRIDSQVIEKITSYLKNNPYMPIYEGKNYSKYSYKERAEISDHRISKRLFQIIEEKETNLCIAVDVNNCDELIKLIEQLGPHICLLQTHVDILNDFDESIIKQLIALSSLYDFLILEDRKFADIGKTVIQQYKNGIYKIEKWAHLVTVCGTSGSGTLEALKSSVNTDKRACFVVSKMNATDAVTDEEYKEDTLETCTKHPDFVIGYIAQRRHLKFKNMICLYESVNLSVLTDSIGKEYGILEKAVTEGVDIITIMTNLHTADDVASIIECKTKCFKAYLNRIS